MFHDFLNLLFPRFCHGCSKELLANEKIICTLCLHELPLTLSHKERENVSKKVFYGRVNIENAVSFLVFEKKGTVQKLIHDLKYKGYQEIGGFFGRWLGNEIREQKNFKNITAVVPVPLHKTKLRKRGYNQVERFGREIARILEVPYVDTVLVKKTSTKTQTIKKRFARWGSMEETFMIENPQILEHHHVLLVDDLVTTGATLEACALNLLKISGTKVSIATMAIAS